MLNWHFVWTIESVAVTEVLLGCSHGDKRSSGVIVGVITLRWAVIVPGLLCCCSPSYWRPSVAARTANMRHPSSQTHQPDQTFFHSIQTRLQLSAHLRPETVNWHWLMEVLPRSPVITLIWKLLLLPVTRSYSGLCGECKNCLAVLLIMVSIQGSSTLLSPSLCFVWGRKNMSFIFVYIYEWTRWGWLRHGLGLSIVITSQFLAPGAAPPLY